MFYIKLMIQKKFGISSVQTLQGIVTNCIHPVYFNVLKFKLKMALIRNQNK